MRFLPLWWGKRQRRCRTSCRKTVSRLRRLGTGVARGDINIEVLLHNWGKWCCKAVPHVRIVLFVGAKDTKLTILPLWEAKFCTHRTLAC